MRANRWWCRNPKNGGARRISPPGPLIDQPACKPGSVGRGASPARDGHSSGTPVARRLEQPTRTAGPGHRSGNLAVPAPSLFGFAPGGVYRAVSVAGNAVRSYRTVSPLPARLHLCARSARAGGLFSVALSLGSPPPDLIRHRMSMEPGLSSPAAFRRAPGRPSGRLMITSWAPLTVGSSPSPSVVAFARGPRLNGRPPGQIAGAR
jgi:hypothetical protein